MILLLGMSLLSLLGKMSWVTAVSLAVIGGLAAWFVEDGDTLAAAHQEVT